MKRVIIIGAGGHGREVADILRHQAQLGAELSIQGFIDEDPDLHNKVINDLPVLGDWSWFEGVDRSEIAVLCAVGSPQRRKRLAERAVSIGLSFTNAISPLAQISPYARIGEGVTLFPFSLAGANTFIDDHAILNADWPLQHAQSRSPFGGQRHGR